MTYEMRVWLTRKEHQLNEAGEFTSNIYPSRIDITTFECNQEATLYPQELTSTLP